MNDTHPPQAAEMEVAGIADVVIRNFEAARQVSGAAYEPERLLAYLTEPPAPKGRRYPDTFAGRWRFVRFMEALQLELGICFTNEEWDRGTGLVELTQAIGKKLANRRNQAQLAAKRVRDARRTLVDEPIKIGLLSGALLGALAAATHHIVGYAVLGGLWLAVVTTTVVLNLKGYAYAKRLAACAARASGDE